MSKTVICALVFGLMYSAQSFAEMDCAAMFQEAESKLSGNKNIPAEKKVELYEMALKAYQECKKGKEKEALDFFNEVFDISDRM